MPRNYSISRDECISTQNSLMEQLKELKDDIQDVALNVAKLPEQLADKFDGRYASKKTEQAVDKVFWLVISAVVIAIMGVILK